MTCRTGCGTKDHRSYAECLRSAGTRVAYTNTAGGWDYTKQKKWDNELSEYRGLVDQGVQPSGTDRASLESAKKLAELGIHERVSFKMDETKA